MEILYKVVQCCVESVCGVKRSSCDGISTGSERWNNEFERVINRKRNFYKLWLMAYLSIRPDDLLYR